MWQNSIYIPRKVTAVMLFLSKEKIDKRHVWTVLFYNGMRLIVLNQTTISMVNIQDQIFTSQRSLAQRNQTLQDLFRHQNLNLSFKRMMDLEIHHVVVLGLQLKQLHLFKVTKVRHVEENTCQSEPNAQDRHHLIQMSRVLAYRAGNLQNSPKNTAVFNLRAALVTQYGSRRAAH